MRRTATGTVSMAAAEATRATSGERQHAAMAQDVGQQRSSGRSCWREIAAASPFAGREDKRCALGADERGGRVPSDEAGGKGHCGTARPDICAGAQFPGRQSGGAPDLAYCPSRLLRACRASMLSPSTSAENAIAA